MIAPKIIRIITKSEKYNFILSNINNYKIQFDDIKIT